MYHQVSGVKRPRPNEVLQDSRAKLFIGGLSFGTSLGDLRVLFEKYGKVGF